MTFTPDQIEMLKAKLDPSHVQPPKQYGPKGHYVEGWHAIAEANRIFGFDAWSYEVVKAICVADKPREIGRDKKPGFGVTYTAHVRVQIDGVLREDVGAGHGYDIDQGLAHESALKEAVTDALKRALRTFGNPFGLALYDKSGANVGSSEPANDPAPKPISSAEQKRQLGEIEKDLLDCDTVADVDKLARTWAAIMKRDGWATDFREIAGAKFEPRRKQIREREAEETVGDIQDEFPGARVVRDQREQYILEAGE